tara:strand:- start:118 stop:360 length:243 start_codon:yes stop_codon:yes gene_type:complete
MADITMCNGYRCNMKETCYRYKAKVNEYRQSYYAEVPHKDKVDEDNNTICSEYWEFDKLGGYKTGIPVEVKDTSKEIKKD